MAIFQNSKETAITTNLVLEKGLEPLRLAASDPKSDASADSATQAYF